MTADGGDGLGARIQNIDAFEGGERGIEAKVEAISIYLRTKE